MLCSRRQLMQARRSSDRSRTSFTVTARVRLKTLSDKSGSSRRKEDLQPDEIKQRAETMFKQGGADT